MLFRSHLRTMERDILMAATKAKKLVTLRHLWSNISKAEQTVITQMQDLDVGVNFADKNLGVVVYDRDLYREQCLLHLEDDKGTYDKIVDRSKEDILEHVSSELATILFNLKRQSRNPCWAYVADSILRDTRNAARKGRLCKFYIMWKLHKAANASGLRSRPIAASIDYVTEIGRAHV